MVCPDIPDSPCLRIRDLQLSRIHPAHHLVDVMLEELESVRTAAAGLRAA